MNYLVTCVCGQQFTVNATQLGRHVTCPGCNRALIPLGAEARGDDAATPASLTSAPEPTKRCPYCGEAILAVAKKCRYCGEFLDRDPAATVPAVASAQVSSAPTGNQAASAALDAAPVFQLSVSQWDNFWKYLICLTIVALTVSVVIIVPLSTIHDNRVVIVACVVLLMAITAYFIFLSTRFARCVIWPTRIETQSGVFAKKRETLELARVADVQLKQGIVERILGIGTITLTTTDDQQPALELYQIPKARKVFKYLQEQAGKTQMAK